MSWKAHLGIGVAIPLGLWGILVNPLGGAPVIIPVRPRSLTLHSSSSLRRIPSVDLG